jgi:hypothetical protein
MNMRIAIWVSMLAVGCAGGSSRQSDGPMMRDPSGTAGMQAAEPMAGSGGAAEMVDVPMGHEQPGSAMDGGIDAAALTAVCADSEPLACVCDDGAFGEQKCLSDGSGYADCQCADAGVDAGTLIGTISTLYVHGRDGDGTPTEWDYWREVPPGPNAVHVNWDGAARIADTNEIVRTALDTYCTGDDWCYVACHSAGCAQVGYALDLYGGIGGNAPWNIFWIAAAGSAAGGSEIADLKLWSASVTLDEDLKTAAMRVLYNHNNTAGNSIFLFAGAGYTDSQIQYNGNGSVLPGDDDLAVAYHSSCAINNDAYMLEDSWCNSGEICSGNYVDLGSPSYLWSMHTIQFLDAAQDYSHFLADDNHGICEEMFKFVEQYAQ